MKRLLSIVLTIVMVASMFTTVSAAPTADAFDQMANSYFPLTAEVLTRKSGTSDEWSAAFALPSDVEANGVGVDYQAKLDMSVIREIFTTSFLTALAESQGKTLTTFSASTVDTDVTITVTFPVAAVIDSNVDLNSTSVGALKVGGSANTQYVAGARSYTAAANSKTWVVEYSCDDIPVSSLIDANATNGWLGDIVFELANTVSYQSLANHRVTVDVKGSAVFDGAHTISGREVEYRANASHITSFTAHVLETIPAVPATCTTGGETEAVRCITHAGTAKEGGGTYTGYDCGAVGLHEATPTGALGHSDLVEFAEVPATCSATGIKLHWTCMRCKGDFFVSNPEITTTAATAAELVIAKTPHNYEDSTNTVLPTCTQDGYIDYGACSECGTVKPRDITLAYGHNVVTVAHLDATCDNDGHTAGKSCSRCGMVFTESKIIPGGHTYGNWVVTKPATEQETGSKQRICSRDNSHIEVIDIPKLEHTCKKDTTVVITAATCLTDGAEQDYCACGLPFGSVRTIPKTGHTFGAQKVAIAATCIQTGMREHYACSKCGKFFADNNQYSENEIADIITPKTAHAAENLVSIPAIAATCTSEGLSAGQKCKLCGTVTVSQTVTSKIPHDIETLLEKKFCEKNGWTDHLHCKVCNKDFTMDGKTELTAEDYLIAPIGHTYDYANETVVDIPASDPPLEEVTVYCYNECENAADVANRHFKVFERDKVMPEHVHTASILRTDKLPNCTEDGYQVTVYKCCGEVDDSVENRVILNSLGHNLKHVRAVPSTCFEEGVQEYWYCKTCSLMFADARGTVVISQPVITGKLEHAYNRIGAVDNTDPKFTIKKCDHCNEVIKIEKTKVNGEDITVDLHDNLMNKKDKIKKDDGEKNANTEVVTETTFNIEEKPLSSELKNQIHTNDTSDKAAGENKVVLEINIEKKTEIKDVTNVANTKIVDVEKENISETDSAIEIVIPIPSYMKEYKDFLVHRKHIQNGVTVYHEIGLKGHKNNPNRGHNTEEYFEYVYGNGVGNPPTHVKLFVRKFSEYAVVGYNIAVNDVVTENTQPAGGGAASGMGTVKFNTNGGTLVEKVTVKRGGTVTEPVTTRKGYIFDGWYTDPTFKKLYDFSSPVFGTITLYAKWIEVSVTDCPKTEEGGCPHFNFADLDPTMWYHDGVDYVLNEGLMNGVPGGIFDPAGELTRAMLVTVLWREEGSPKAGVSSFADLEEDSYYAEAVAWAAGAGIVTGYSDEAFGPNDNILREQIATIMYRYAQYKGYDVSVGENTNILSYEDYAEISEYAIPAMQYAAGSGLMTGRTEATLNPKDNTTRAEMAVILYRFFTAE